MPDPSRIFAPDLLADRVVLVTGGGTGLGLAAARELLASGASVLLAGRRAEVLSEACASLGEGCSWVVGDVRDRESCDATVDFALEQFGRLDVVVNNAG